MPQKSLDIYKTFCGIFLGNLRKSWGNPEYSYGLHYSLSEWVRSGWVTDYRIRIESGKFHFEPINRLPSGLVE